MARNKKKAAAEKTPEAVPATPPKEPKAPKKVKVSLVQLGTAAKPFELTAGATVGDLLAAAGLSAKTGEVLVNSQHVELDEPLKEGASVVFATNIKGGRH